MVFYNPDDAVSAHMVSQVGGPRTAELTFMISQLAGHLALARSSSESSGRETRERAKCGRGPVDPRGRTGRLCAREELLLMAMECMGRPRKSRLGQVRNLELLL